MRLIIAGFGLLVISFYAAAFSNDGVLVWDEKEYQRKVATNSLAKQQDIIEFQKLIIKNKKKKHKQKSLAEKVKSNSNKSKTNKK